MTDRIESKRPESFSTGLAGYNFPNPDGTVRKAVIQDSKDASLFDCFELRRELDNPYDKNAVGIFRSACKEYPEGVQIGYVPAHRAPIVASAMDAGIPVTVMIQDWGKKWSEIRIWLSFGPTKEESE